MSKALYSREPVDFDDHAKVSILHVVKTGEIIGYAESGSYQIAEGGGPESDAGKIKAGAWALWEGQVSAETFAELTDGNVKVSKGELVLIGEKTWSDQKPTIEAVQP